jgi:hypothetical protein
MITRAPVAPNGWPMEIEPPVTLKRSRSTSPIGLVRPSSASANFLEANAFMLETIWAANASCISTRSMSESSRPARSRANGAAKAGPWRSWVAGSREVKAKERM